jgi:uncharacterized protein YbjT (DUF2867 family)/quercetin dioxygenase-like cupin family protein
METPRPTLLVTGATGNQGGAVARELLRRARFTVRALVRDRGGPAAQGLEQLGAELAEGNFDDRASLDRALQGVTGVFSVQVFQDGTDVEVRHGKALADAAKAARVSHFVYSSVGSAERNTGIPHFESKFQIEEHIRRIGLPYTILRPVAFLYNYNGLRPMIEAGRLIQPLAPSTRLQQLSEDDYGAMVAEVFERPGEFLNRAIEVASVDMTMTEVAAAFSRVLGRAVTYEQIPFEAFEQRAGEEITTMFRWFEQVGYHADLEQVRREFFVPTDLESYLRDHGWAHSSNGSQTSIPPDDVRRQLTHVRPDDDPGLRHISVVGDTYTILLAGEETAGRYCLIDMLVPPGGGPPPHRHDFEEMFTVLEGEIELFFRGARSVARAGETVNIPANAPHAFRNVSERPARLLCMCAPAGQEQFFLAIGDPVATRTAPPPKLSEAEQAERRARAVALAPQFRTELLPP